MTEQSMIAVPAPDGLTASQRRIFEALADGAWHSRTDLLQAITRRRFASASLVPTHVLRLRAKLDRGVCRIDSSPAGYRMVTLERGQ